MPGDKPSQPWLRAAVVGTSNEVFGSQGSFASVTRRNWETASSPGVVKPGRLPSPTFDRMGRS